MTRNEKRYLKSHKFIKHVLFWMLANPDHYSMEEIARYHPNISLKSLEETRKALI